ncbi:divergent PAP2 family protein [Commensalibacter papalotli (ex Servin-Garciduenas et al. 2014)]|uniref:Acid phosphatase/vanadium-dependent haloperoxidase-like protein n=1 Tax=Commensalibacter papalotli (ex Servin-Garciduenas et al. 2014) TaxID=1208583 RepID=W7E8H9_9PROT|nr:divergent PAP2 family protein [Commensalibacter papalotli (ex Servin-Garciduenas et al. 2014)]EUK19441.1 acid phosphatase/vanadium-dependent haloperoxidase-like protein [Commensalibacter papalotli (ex Servin-Garciduenas et al. 2014)]
MSFYSYLITPFLAWLCTGSLKFLINSIKAKQLAFKLIGYGGMPSNHSAIVTSMASLIAFKQSINSPAFGVAVTLAFIVIMDANGLRRTVGKHAIAINQVNLNKTEMPPLRERVGHSKGEILAGICVGICVGYIAHLI